jgi:hypothetical protein
MADENQIGKQYKGDAFPAAKTPEMAKQEAAVQAQYDDKDAVPLLVYLQRKGIFRVEERAARQRFTTVRQATMEKWDEIFERF